MNDLPNKCDSRKYKCDCIWPDCPKCHNTGKLAMMYWVNIPAVPGGKKDVPLYTERQCDCPAGQVRRISHVQTRTRDRGPRLTKGARTL